MTVAWLPTNEVMPEHGVTVWVCTASGRIHLARRSLLGRNFWTDVEVFAGTIYERVTFWCPLERPGAGVPPLARYRKRQAGLEGT